MDDSVQSDRIFVCEPCISFGTVSLLFCNIFILICGQVIVNLFASQLFVWGGLIRWIMFGKLREIEMKVCMFIYCTKLESHLVSSA